MKTSIRIPVLFGLGPGGEYNGSRAVRAVAFLIAAVLLVLGSTLVSGALPGALMASFGSAFGIGAVLEFAATRYMRSRTVSVFRTGNSLTIAPPVLAVAASNLGIALSLIAVAHLQFDAEAMGSLDWYERRVAVGIPMLGVFLVVHELWNLLRAPGLTLTKLGIRGVRYGPQLKVEWWQVSAVKVADSKRGKVLHIVVEDRSIRIPHRAVGGDLHAVATVIDYYLEHPDGRHRLTDGLAAVEHVNAEYRAGRYRRV